MFILGLAIVPRITKYDYKKIVAILIKSSLATAVMGAVGYYLKGQVNLILTIVLAGISYFIALYAFKGFKKEDLISIIQSFTKKTSEDMILDSPGQK